MVTAKGWGRGERGHHCLMGSGLQCEKLKKLWRWMIMKMAQQCGHTWCHWITCLETATMVTFMLRIFYCNLKKRKKLKIIKISLKVLSTALAQFKCSTNRCIAINFIIYFWNAFESLSQMINVTHFYSYWRQLSDFFYMNPTYYLGFWKYLVRVMVVQGCVGYTHILTHTNTHTHTPIFY